MKNKRLIYSVLYVLAFMSFTQDVFARDYVHGSKMIEYLTLPEDVVIYYDKSKESQILPKIPEYWNEVVGHVERAEDGSTWYRLYLIDGAYADKFYLHHGAQAYISSENVGVRPDKALSGLYDGKYLAAYYFEGKERIVLFSESDEGENRKTLHAYGFDGVGAIEDYNGLDTRNLKLAFHQENSIKNCSSELVFEYVDRPLMEDTDIDGIDEIWYTFPNMCENPYEPEEFHVIMLENEDNFHAMKKRKSAGPAYEESVFEPIDSNIQHANSNEVAESMLTWTVSNIMTEDMYVEKTKKELLGKWTITSMMIDFEYTFPKNEQIEIEFLEDGTMLFNNPQNEEFPRGNHSYKWYFPTAERVVYLKIGDAVTSFDFAGNSGSIHISSVYYMFTKNQ